MRPLGNGAHKRLGSSNDPTGTRTVLNSIDHGNAGDGLPIGSDGPGERNRNSASDQANPKTGTLHGTFLEGTTGAQGPV